MVLANSYRMEALVVLFLFLIIAAVYAVSQYQLANTWHIVRSALEATWPMYPGAKEGFEGELVSAQGITTPALKKWLPAPEYLTKSTVGDCPNALFSAGNYEGGLGGAMKSFDLLSDWIPGRKEPRVAAGPTSQQCYEVDWARGLERAGSYAQRTNNYLHGTPENCSAPNHDLLLDFYINKPSGPPYQV